MATPIFDHTQVNIFQSTLISLNLHQYAKNQASSFCSRDIVNLKVLQSDWLRAFWPISQEPDTANITKFLYRPNVEKTNH